MSVMGPLVNGKCFKGASRPINYFCFRSLCRSVDASTRPIFVLKLDASSPEWGESIALVSQSKFPILAPYRAPA